MKDYFELARIASEKERLIQWNDAHKLWIEAIKFVPTQATIDWAECRSSFCLRRERYSKLYFS
ncbi:ANR family transcriptional regulator [Vibrio jasicida]|uniref:ANR family transcriptional regulator n=1 Tax=Vibrio jasicida TaxID=766224 RepID=UPI00163E2FC0